MNPAHTADCGDHRFRDENGMHLCRPTRQQRVGPVTGPGGGHLVTRAVSSRVVAVRADGWDGGLHDLVALDLYVEGRPAEPDRFVFRPDDAELVALALLDSVDRLRRGMLQ